MKKIYALFTASMMLASALQAKTYYIGSGKWNDAKIWTGDYAGTTVQANDEVIVTGQVTVTTPIVVSGILHVQKGASMVGMKDLMITPSGKFVNDGNTVMKHIINNGTIENNLILEAMMDIDNTGSIDNDNNIVAGNNLQNFGGNAAGNGGTYFVNNQIHTSPAATFGNQVKVFYGNSIENMANTNPSSPMNLLATIEKDHVVLQVSNPGGTPVSVFSVEKSTDGQNFTLVSMVKQTNSEYSMNYTDRHINSNLTYYRVKAINDKGEETALPIASVQMPMSNMYSMAKF